MLRRKPTFLTSPSRLLSSVITDLLARGAIGRLLINPAPGSAKAAGTDTPASKTKAARTTANDVQSLENGFIILSLSTKRLNTSIVCLSLNIV